jgi:RNA processing factor Prp31
MITPEESMLATKLESIKESIIGFKYVTDSLLDRADKTDLELANVRATLGRFESNGVRIDERMANIERYIDSMRNDIRSVRNAVIGSMIAATFIGIAGLAVTGLSLQKNQNINNLPAVGGRSV